MNNNSYWGNGYMGPYHPPYHHNMHEVPPYDPYYPYYAPDPLQDSFQELKHKYKELEAKNQELKKEVASLKRKEGKRDKRKVQRRSEEELVKNICCPYYKCKKQYASGLALNLHMRIKHNGGTKKEREEAAEAIIKAELQGKEPPQIKINLSPNYVQNYRKQKMGQLEKGKSEQQDQIDEGDDILLSEIEKQLKEEF